MLSTKPPRCKHCKERTDRPGKRLHDACIDPWLEAHKATERAKKDREQRARAKVERAVTKKRRTALETIPELIKAAQREFNRYIRLRDAGQACICCGRPLDGSDVGGMFDCGHYRSVGSASHLRFHELNAHGQTKQCNRYGAGRAVDYRIGLIARIGLEAVEALEASNTPHKWTHDELREIRQTYRAKCKELEKRLENA